MKAETLKEKIGDLRARLRTVKATERYLGAYEEKLKKVISEQTLSPDPQTDAWRKTLAALGKRRRALDAERAGGERELAELSSDLGTVSHSVRQLENPEPRAVRIVEIQVEAEAPMTVDLSILYEMANAGWDAIYVVREAAGGRRYGPKI